MVNNHTQEPPGSSHWHVILAGRIDAAEQSPWSTRSAGDTGLVGGHFGFPEDWARVASEDNCGLAKGAFVMRWTGWILAVAVMGLSGPAAGSQPGCAGCNGGMAGGVRAQRGLDAEPCASPCGYSLAPGCCEDTRHCCDNAWAGYCDHRAKVDAYWTRVGVPGACACRKPCRNATEVPCVPCCPRETAPIQPTPAAPVPAPAPAKAAGSRSIRLFTVR
jgi:hypothetical protein